MINKKAARMNHIHETTLRASKDYDSEFLKIKSPTLSKSK